MFVSVIALFAAGAYWIVTQTCSDSTSTKVGIGYLVILSTVSVVWDLAGKGKE